MRVRFTILICALLVLGLAVSQVNAQGYQVRVRPNNVVEGGNNQELGAIRLTHRTLMEAGANIVENGTIEITFSGLTLDQYHCPRRHRRQPWSLRQRTVLLVL